MGAARGPRSLIMGVSALILTSATGALAFWLAQAPAAPPLTFKAAPCSEPLRWAPVYLSEPSAAQVAGDGWNFWSASAIGTQVCGPGQLEIGVRPESAEGDPHLTVMLDGEQLGEFPVPASRTLRLQVPRAGSLSLAYLNDYYRADVRAVEIQQVRSDVLGCRRLTPDRPPTNPRNTYVPQSDLLVLLDPDPIPYTLCGPGTLQVVLRGMPGANELPLVEVVHQGRRLVKWQAPVNPTAFTVRVPAGEVTLNMINPYAQQTADRNLMVTRLRWTPQPRP